MAWTSIPKPTGTTYTDVNPTSKTQYDDIFVTYDSSSIFYDGGNPSLWTAVSHPTDGYNIPWSSMNFAWSDANLPWGSSTGWTNVPKPI